MKPKETNTATITPTEAHRSLVAHIVNYDHEAEARACSEIRDDFAKLVITSAQLADSNVGLRQERDQLRADCENETKWAAHYLADAQNARARAERAEAELADHKSALEIANRSADEQMRYKREAEAELATEREKVRALRDALTEIMENSSGWAESTAREALESTEGAK